MKPTIVEILWEDIVHHGPGWGTMDYWKEQADTYDTLHRTVGYLLKETDDYVAVLQNFADEPSGSAADGMVRIPRGAIKKVKYMKGMAHQHA